MSRPTDDPVVWSSDANYPAGADSWNGTPTKVTPSAGVAAAGWEPEDLPPAQHLNYLLNNHGGWLEHFKGLLDSLPLDNWQGYGVASAESYASYSMWGEFDGTYWRWVRGSGGKLIKTSINNGDSWVNASVPAGWGAAAETRKIISDGTYLIAVGRSGGNWIATSTDSGANWTDRSPAGTAGLYSVAWDGGTAYVAVGTSGGIYLASNPTGTWTAQTPAASYAGQFRAVFWDGSQFVAVGSSGAIQTSPDGATWTARTPAASYAGTFVGIGGDGSRLIAWGDSALAMQYSDDGGVNWTDATSAIPSWITTASDVLWSPTFGQWIFTGSGLVARTVEPVAGTWWPIASFWGGADDGVSANQITGAAGITDIGGQLAVACDASTGGGSTPHVFSMRARGT